MNVTKAVVAERKACIVVEDQASVFNMGWSPVVDGSCYICTPCNPSTAILRNSARSRTPTTDTQIPAALFQTHPADSSWTFFILCSGLQPRVASPRPPPVWEQHSLDDLFEDIPLPGENWIVFQLTTPAVCFVSSSSDVIEQRQDFHMHHKSCVRGTPDGEWG